MGPLRNLANQYKHGTAGNSVEIMLSFVSEFVQLEEIFSPSPNGSDSTEAVPVVGTRADRYSESINRLRTAHKSDLQLVYDIAMSHERLMSKIPVLVQLLRRATEVARQAQEEWMLAQEMSGQSSAGLASGNSGSTFTFCGEDSSESDQEVQVPGVPEPFAELLSKVSQVLLKIQALPVKQYADISLEARNLLLELHQPSAWLQRREVGKALRFVNPYFSSLVDSKFVLAGALHK